MTLALIITVFVQLKIEVFKKSVDCRSETNQIETGNSENVEYQFRKNLLRFAIMLLCISFLIIMDWLLRERVEAENKVLSKLRMAVTIQYLSCNIIVIFIPIIL